MHENGEEQEMAASSAGAAGTASEVAEEQVTTMLAGVAVGNSQCPWMVEALGAAAAHGASPQGSMAVPWDTTITGTNREFLQHGGSCQLF